MGVAYCLKRASDAELALLQGKPKLIGQFLYEDPDTYEQPETLGSRIGKFFGGAAASPDITFAPREEIDLDKAWHVLHFLLTGSNTDEPHPLNLIGHDWPPLANVNNGLGPPMAVSSAALREFHAAFDRVSDDEIMQRWDADQIREADLYIGDVLADEGEEGQEYVLEYLVRFRKFVTDCVQGADGTVVWYS